MRQRDEWLAGALAPEFTGAERSVLADAADLLARLGDSGTGRAGRAGPPARRPAGRSSGRGRLAEARRKLTSRTTGAG
jgi:hypothetical protein